MTVKKVLIVDDSRPDLLNLEKIVSGAGVLVLTAASGKEAVQKANADKPDLIFMDVNMAEMDGYAATRTLQGSAETKSIPVVFVTSKSQKADKVWGQMVGGKGYVTKPYSSDQILEQMRAF